MILNIRLPHLILLLEPLHHLLHLPIPISPHRQQGPQHSAIHEGNGQSDPEAVQA